MLHFDPITESRFYMPRAKYLKTFTTTVCFIKRESSGDRGI